MWYPNFVKRRKRQWYSTKVVGGAKPESHLRRPSRAQILAAAKRFSRSGEIRNAVEMLKLAYFPQQLKLYFKDDEKEKNIQEKAR